MRSIDAPVQVRSVSEQSERQLGLFLDQEGIGRTLSQEAERRARQVLRERGATGAQASQVINRIAVKQ